ncbi:uncharacterized protein LOC114356679 [Ostrinia furnacalis]|uniref:uncharacterized protein LOC114356679 n=1 Tax=Ostrinia furnacalis TaxID=93504 RepID=UPI00103C321D|nr:uncharacterized protein LOC114356679 [Ostrinia furnacalis]
MSISLFFILFPNENQKGFRRGRHLHSQLQAASGETGTSKDRLRSYNATLRAKLNLLKAELDVKELVLPIEEESLSQDTKTKKVLDEAVTFIDISKQLHEKRGSEIDLLRSYNATLRDKYSSDLLKAELNVEELVLPIEEESLSQNVSFLRRPTILKFSQRNCI